MIKYREHRGSLEDSLDTSREFDTIKELFKFLINEMSQYCCHISIQDIKVEYYGFDERCNQELYVVSSEKIGVFGFIYEDYIDGN